MIYLYINAINWWSSTFEDCCEKKINSLSMTLQKEIITESCSVSILCNTKDKLFLGGGLFLFFKL